MMYFFNDLYISMIFDEERKDRENECPTYTDYYFQNGIVKHAFLSLQVYKYMIFLFMYLFICLCE